MAHSFFQMCVGSGQTLYKCMGDVSRKGVVYAKERLCLQFEVPTKLILVIRSNRLMASD